MDVITMMEFEFPNLCCSIQGFRQCVFYSLFQGHIKVVDVLLIALFRCRFSELAPGLLLRQPRLLAGVYVVGLMKASVKYKPPVPQVRPNISQPRPPSISSIPRKVAAHTANGTPPSTTSGTRIYTSVKKTAARTKIPPKKRREYEEVF